MPKIIRDRETVSSSCGTLLASQPRGSSKNPAPKERHDLVHGTSRGLKVPSSDSPFLSPARAGEGKARQRRREGFRTQGLERVKESVLTLFVAAGFSPAPYISGICPPEGGLYEQRRRFFHTFSRLGLRSCAPNRAVARSGSQSGTLSTNFRFTLLALFPLLIPPASCTKSEKPATESQKPAATEAAQRTFASPADAGKALVEAAKAEDHNALVAIFGPGSNDLIFSGDEAQNKLSFEHFTSAFETMNRWRKQTDGSEVLCVGADNGPFPIPLKKNDAGQ
jgi:hypothetical protein